MTTLLTIGWWLSVIIILLLLVAFLFGAYEEHRHRPTERILEYLSGKRDWVPGKDIWESLNLPIGMTYLTLSRLEDQGAVISEPRENGRRYYKATGTRRPDENVSLQPALASG